MSSSGQLFVVATPIGNLEDMSFRAVRTLKNVSQILAEDTRRTRKLCTHFDIRTPLRAYHAYSSKKTDTQLCESMCQGTTYALVTDAGMPLLSDPGGSLVHAAIDNGIHVECIPGPSAILNSLVLSGFREHRFSFFGFITRTGAKRRADMMYMRDSLHLTVFFESPKRLSDTLRELQNVVGPERRVAVCRELTKLHEEVIRGEISNVIQNLPENILGEISVVVDAAPSGDLDKISVDVLDRQIRDQLLHNKSIKDVTSAIALDTGWSKRDIYQRAVSIKESLVFPEAAESKKI